MFTWLMRIIDWWQTRRWRKKHYLGEVVSPRGKRRLLETEHVWIKTKDGKRHLIEVSK